MARAHLEATKGRKLMFALDSSSLGLWGKRLTNWRQGRDIFNMPEGRHLGSERSETVATETALRTRI